jgi:hypothetical protein
MARFCSFHFPKNLESQKKLTPLRPYSAREGEAIARATEAGHKFGAFYKSNDKFLRHRGYEWNEARQRMESVPYSVDGMLACDGDYRAGRLGVAGCRRYLAIE